MRTNPIFALLLIGLFTNCESKSPETKRNMVLKAKESFVRIDDTFAIGTSLLMNRNITNVEGFRGDFLSRLWTLYGKPNGVAYEGFQYTFKDVQTGLIFTAYSAGSGPAYGGNSENKTALIPIITKFDKMLDETENADCEVSFETDFGTLKAGAKNGKPYDKLIE